MSGGQEKSTSTGAEQAPNNPPALPQYPPQPFPGAPYPPPPGAYTWYYPPPTDPNGDPNAPPPGPYVMFPPPGIMYGYPPPAPAQGKSHSFVSSSLSHTCLMSVFYSLSTQCLKVMGHFPLPRLPLSPVRSASRSRWRYDSRCFTFSPCVDWRIVCFKCTNCASACKRCDEARPCIRCQKYGLTDTCVDGVRKARKVGVKRGPYKRKSKAPAPETPPYPGQSGLPGLYALSHAFL
jgi:hypothetical protein